MLSVVSLGRLAADASSRRPSMVARRLFRSRPRPAQRHGRVSTGSPVRGSALASMRRAPSRRASLLIIHRPAAVGLCSRLAASPTRFPGGDGVGALLARAACAAIVSWFVVPVVATTGRLVPAAGVLRKERAASEERDDRTAPGCLRGLIRRRGAFAGRLRLLVLIVGKGLCVHAHPRSMGPFRKRPGGEVGGQRGGAEPYMARLPSRAAGFPQEHAA